MLDGGRCGACVWLRMICSALHSHAATFALRPSVQRCLMHAGAMRLPVACQLTQVCLAVLQGTGCTAAHACMHACMAEGQADAKGDASVALLHYHGHRMLLCIHLCPQVRTATSTLLPGMHVITISTSRVRLELQESPQPELNARTLPNCHQLHCRPQRMPGMQQCSTSAQLRNASGSCRRRPTLGHAHTILQEQSQTNTTANLGIKRIAQRTRRPGARTPCARARHPAPYAPLQPCARVPCGVCLNRMWQQRCCYQPSCTPHIA